MGPSPQGNPFSAAQWLILTRRAWLGAALAATATALNNAAAAPQTGAVTSLAVPRTTYRGTLQMASDPLSYLDRVVLLCDFPVREKGESSWPQGVSINKAAKKIYVSNQSGTKLRIDVRNLPSGVRKSSRTITTENLCWTEALPWFYNQRGQLCFIIRATGGGPASSSTYAIYNYTTGTKGPNIPIKGVWRADVSGRYFATTDAGTTSVKNFYVYDWRSIRNGTPALLATIPAKAGAKTAAKNQGLAWVGKYFYLIQGSQSESPTFQAWDSNGKLTLSRKYTRADFRNVVNKLKPGYLTNANYTYEAEGAFNLDGRLVSVQIVNNNPSVTKDGRVLVLQHNRIDGVRGKMQAAKPLSK
jgi:hypothetical protein